MNDIEAMILGRARYELSEVPADKRPSLVRLSAGYSDNQVSWQVVVQEDADEDELEEYECIFGGVLCDFYDATGDSQIIKVKSVDDCALPPPLRIVIFVR